MYSDSVKIGIAVGIVASLGSNVRPAGMHLSSGTPLELVSFIGELFDATTIFRHKRKRLSQQYWSIQNIKDIENYNAMRSLLDTLSLSYLDSH